MIRMCAELIEFMLSNADEHTQGGSDANQKRREDEVICISGYYQAVWYNRTIDKVERHKDKNEGMYYNMEDRRHNR